MKINWKVRLKNPNFIFQIILAMGVPVLAYMGITAQDITSWGVLFDLILDALSNPYIIGLVIVSVYNAVTDPTVRGISDSRQALRYDYPKNND